ncbi:MAG: tripartite tricarboxylate transporter substrate binding protein [Xanthobacteraceae bacterium]|nr:tripartite tricarboxylate transporter substrate binding protein [Xanthobacteraceae bacterium]
MRMKLALAALLMLAPGEISVAQKFPDRAVRIIVPNPPGGSNDGAARIVGQGLTDLLWPSGVVIENRAGGGGNVGAHAAATATPDGYTLLLTSPGPIVINPFLYKRLPFDSQKDFVPIALVASVPIVLMVNPNVDARSVGELIALIRRENGKFVYASSGVGSTHHLSAELFRRMANVTLQHVPYRGAAPAMNDLIAGHVPMLFDNITTVIPQVKAGKVRALAVASAQRVPWLPDVPTFAEAGLPEFEASSWFGLFAQRDTPADTLAKATADVKRVLTTPAISRRLEDAGAIAGNAFGPEFAKFLETEREKWSDVIKTSGASVPE